MLHDIILPLCIGLAVFLFGMKMMEFALHLWAGPRMIQLVHSSTQTPVHGMVVSAGATALLQSSTAITVISIGLVNAGLLSFPRTLGIILGSNIGTCLTTELIGLNINHLGGPLLTAAVALWILAVVAAEIAPRPFERIAHWLQPMQYAAIAVAGFALVLIGIRYMQSIGSVLQSYGMFAWFLERSGQSLLWGIAAGACLTAIIHSSAAMIGMTMGLAAMGAIPIDLGVAIVLGANIGTCVTALMASFGGSRSASFVAWSHIALNVGGAILFYPLIGHLQAASAWISADPAGQIAHAQTIFNIVCSLLALPLCYLPVWKKLG